MGEELKKSESNIFDLEQPESSETQTGWEGLTTLEGREKPLPPPPPPPPTKKERK
jgi:hypothetical protein